MLPGRHSRIEEQRTTGNPLDEYAVDLSGTLIYDLETATQRQSGARLVGYLRALRKAGIPWNRENILSSDGYSAERAYNVVAKRFQHDAPSALFATDNVMTIGAFRALRALELKIPEDVSLLGFDDLEWTRLVTPLTVVSQLVPTWVVLNRTGF
jgi:LacI family transcriptional regulator